jgi:G6PDH family F420-dependent oxidoreductase
MRIGFALSCEEYRPAELIEQAKLAQEAGFAALWISDHYHPWNDAQGQSPFVWSMIGALSQATDLPIITAVTCPTVRIHPAVIAQAAATSATLTGGKFVLGVGSGEALNEHILGDRWPPASLRLEMLEEAIDVMRQLWQGESVTHYGTHYTVEQARLYTLPDEPVPVYISGFGPRATDLAGRVGDGFISVVPNADAVSQFRETSNGKPAVAGAKACYAGTEDEARRIALRLWPQEGVPGELAQILPTPQHFEQVSQLVTPDMIKMACGPDADAHLAMVREYEETGYDTLYVAPVGPHYREMIELYRDKVLSNVSAAG